MNSKLGCWKCRPGRGRAPIAQNTYKPFGGAGDGSASANVYVRAPVRERKRRCCGKFRRESAAYDYGR